MTAEKGAEVIAMIGDTLQYPASSDYIYGGAPLVPLSPQHAHLFRREGWSKAQVKRLPWEASKMRAGRSRGSAFERMATARRAVLGELGPDTIVPISEQPEDLSIVVAGGPGSHSVFVPVSAHTRSVTRQVVLSE